MNNTSIMKRQRGAVLMTTLLLLLVMTLLGFSGMRTTILEEKMAGNFRDANLAFQSSESGLRAAEAFIDANPTANYNNVAAGLYQPTNADPPRWEQVNWDNADEILAYPTVLSTELADPPDGIIEELEIVLEVGDSQEAGMASESQYYRVTADAVGGSENAKVRLQTTYKR